MDFFDILFAKKNAPLPENGYLKTEVVSYPTTAEQLPIPKCDIAITDQKQCQVIVSDIPVFDNDAPYLFRESAGGNNVLERNLTGATIAENQLVQNGNFSNGNTGWSTTNYASLAVANSVGTITLNESVNDRTFLLTNTQTTIVGHKYLCSYECKINPSNTCKQIVIGMRGASNIRTNTSWSRYYDINNINSVDSYFLVATGQQESAIGDEFLIKNVICVDLTQMFGSTIADYVYSLEQSTTGSGIAWLKSYGFLTNDYYPYSEGGLQSVKTSGKKVTGKNLLPSSFDSWSLANPYLYVKLHGQGNWTSTISFSDNDTSVNTSGCYMGYVKNPYNAELEYHWVLQNGVVSSSSYTSSNGYIFIYPATEETFNKIFSRYKIQVEIGTTATNYEAYNPSITYPLGNDDLRGVIKLTNNALTYDGDTKTSDGVINRRYGVVDLGDLTWVRATYQGVSYLSANISGCISNVSSASGKIPIISKLYTPKEATSVIYLTDKTVIYKIDSQGVYIRDDSYTDATAFKTAMSGTYLVYELAAPTQETSTPYTELQTVYDGGTEEFIDTRDVPVPVGHESTYYNGQAYITDFDNPTTGIIHMAELHSIVPPRGEFYIESNGTMDVDAWKK